MRHRGRNRRAGLREPNGRISRVKDPSADKTVLAQPHRRGNKDQRCASVFGRFCLRMGLRPELYDVGEKYGAAVRRWRALKGIPTPFDNRSSSSWEPRPPPAVEAINRRMERMERAIVFRAGSRALIVLRLLAVDGAPIGVVHEPCAIAGLMALAVHIGWLRPGDDPYVRRPALPIRRKSLRHDLQSQADL